MSRGHAPGGMPSGAPAGWPAEPRFSVHGHLARSSCGSLQMSSCSLQNLAPSMEKVRRMFRAQKPLIYLGVY